MMKNVKLVLLCCLLLGSGVYAQKSLKQQMWEFSGYDGDELRQEIKNDRSEDLTEDIKNGYISYFGGGGDLGFDMAAFRDKRGNYTLVKQLVRDNKYQSPPDTRIQLKPDKSQQLLGMLNIKQFISNFGSIIKPQDNKIFDYAPFYYRFELPRYGTDMTVYLKLELLDYRRDALDFVALSGKVYKVSIDKIQIIAKKINNIETMELIRKGQFDRIPPNEQKLIKSIVEDRQWYKKLSSYRFFDDKTDGVTTIAELTHELNQLYLLYQLSKNIDHKVILGWNKQTAQFYVKQVIPMTVDKDKTGYRKYRNYDWNSYPNDEYRHHNFNDFLKGSYYPDDDSTLDETYNNYPSLYHEDLGN